VTMRNLGCEGKLYSNHKIYFLARAFNSRDEGDSIFYIFW
jgi:hypothetical protein